MATREVSGVIAEDAATRTANSELAQDTDPVCGYAWIIESTETDLARSTDGNAQRCQLVTIPGPEDLAA